MKRPELHLARPLYEGLPWIYMLCGLLGLAASYVHRGSGVLAAITGILGVLSLIGGVVVLLRRRDFRELRSHYAASEAPLVTRPDD